MSDKPSREDKRQRTAFYIYANMVTPSVSEMYQTWFKDVSLKNYKRPALRTLKEWRRKYEWVERREAFQQEVKEQEQKKRLEAVIMKNEEILALTRAVMIRYGQQLRANKQSKIEFGDVEKAVKIQRLVLGQPTDIGQHEVNIKDDYSGLTDEELLSKLERFTKRYKNKLKNKNEKNSN